LTSQQIEIEKQRVKAEIREKDYDKSLDCFTEQIIWKGTKLTRDIAGKIKLLNKMGKTRLVKAHREMFQKENIFFYLTGKVGEQDILYLNQDMREFELYGTVAAVVSFCDSMNYLTSEEELLQVFKLVNNYLDPGGYFIFDMKTEYHYETLMGNRTIVDNREDCSLIWENFYDKEKQLNQYDITIYAKAEFEEEDEDDEMPPLFERMEESHVQRAYTVEKVKELLEQAGLEFVAVYGDGTKDDPKPEDGRVYFVARETYQENKYYE
jgi:hypothetical protein